MKQCPKCKKVKSVKDFHKDKIKKDGLSSYCKKCACKKANEWQKNNHEKAHANKMKYQRENVNECRARIKEWAKNNSEKVSAINQRKRINKKNAEGSFTLDEWEKLKKKYDYTCPGCKEKEPFIILTTDHIFPLSKGGNDYIQNIQPLCIKCNSKKSTKTICYAN